MKPGRRLSGKTRSVLQALAQQDRFVTAGDLHLLMRQTGHAIGLITVYRALHVLEQHKLVDTVIDGKGRHLHRHCSPSPHQHLICSRCHTTVELPEPSPLVEWTSPVIEDLGFTDIVIRIRVNGLCPGCAA